MQHSREQDLKELNAAIGNPSIPKRDRQKAQAARDKIHRQMLNPEIEKARQQMIRARSQGDNRAADMARDWLERNAR